MAVIGWLELQRLARDLGHFWPQQAAAMSPLAAASRAALLAVVVFALLAEARQSRGGSRKDLNVNVRSHAVSISSRFRGDNLERRLTFDFTTNGFPRIRARFVQSSANETRASFRVGLRQLIEFVDRSNACINPGDNDTYNSTVINFVGHSNDWTNVNNSGPIDVNGTTYYRFCTSLTRPRGKVTLCVRVSDDVVRAPGDNVQLFPNAIKVDVVFENLSYLGNNTNIALVAMVQNRGETTLDSGAENVAIGIGSLDWVNYALAGDTLANATNVVGISSSRLFLGATDFNQGEGSDSGEDDDNDSGEQIRRIAFCPNNATQQWRVYNWDPEIGFDESAASSAAAMTRSMLAVLVAALAALAALTSF
jgi:hypothetical protein